MIKRIRDKLRNFKPQQKVPFEQWDDMNTHYGYATNFMTENNPAYMTMMADLRNAESIILQNRVKEVREVHVITEILSKIFITRKQEQLDELVGQVKYIRQFLAELQSWIDLKREFEKMEADGKIAIVRNPEFNE